MSTVTGEWAGPMMPPQTNLEFATYDVTCKDHFIYGSVFGTSGS